MIAVIEMTVYFANQAQIVVRIEGPAIVAAIPLFVNRSNAKHLGPLIKQGCDVLPLMWLIGISPRLFQRFDRERLCIKTARIGSRQNVAGEVGALLSQRSN